MALGAEIYGVTTGYGNSVSVPIPRELVEELPLNLTRFHGCGLGRELSPAAGRAVLAVRLASLAQGYQGCGLSFWSCSRPSLTTILCRLFPKRVRWAPAATLPRFLMWRPRWGRARGVLPRGRQPARAALAEAGLQPLKFSPKRRWP